MAAKKKQKKEFFNQVTDWKTSWKQLENVAFSIAQRFVSSLWLFSPRQNRKKQQQKKNRKKKIFFFFFFLMQYRITLM